MCFFNLRGYGEGGRVRGREGGRKEGGRESRREGEREKGIVRGSDGGRGMNLYYNSFRQCRIKSNAEIGRDIVQMYMYDIYQSTETYRLTEDMK